MRVKNSTQVQSTNDASTTSKYSAVNKNYFKDDFIECFVEKPKPRASLINLGYYTRAVLLIKLITHYIEYIKSKNIFKFQIVSCGAGFDTSYWRLSELNLLTSDSIFIEVDFPSVISKKIAFISKSKLSDSFKYGFVNSKIHSNISKLSSNYYLVGADLSDLTMLETLFNVIGVDAIIPTLFLSECVITYMKKNSSNLLIEWMGKKFQNGAFINYEQIHPDDGFGQVMLKHFEKLQSPLHSVVHYPDCASHSARYKFLGFHTSRAVSEWDAFVSLTDESDRKTAFTLELFDEFEEFHNKCVHYVIGISGNQISSNWMNQLALPSINCNSCTIKALYCNQVSTTNLNVYRHCSFKNKKNEIVVLGGCNKERRSSDVFKIGIKMDYNIQPVEVIKTFHASLDVVYGSVCEFVLNDSEYCCVYGGRTSPDSPSNSGAFIIFQLSDDKFITKYNINVGNPSPHFRGSMISLKQSEAEVNVWIFGGRSCAPRQVLTQSTRSSAEDEESSTLWKLELVFDDRGLVRHNWKPHKRRGKEPWPSGRMSHGISALSKSWLFVSCGLTTDSFTVLNDVWKWNCRLETWEKMVLTGRLLPRYGHSSHIAENALLLVGGVNTMAGLQPGLAKIHLENGTVIEYSFQFSGPEPVLVFNHTSEIIENIDEKRQLIILGGGGNCFSFGTYLNKGIYGLQLDEVND